MNDFYGPVSVGKRMTLGDMGQQARQFPRGRAFHGPSLNQGLAAEVNQIAKRLDHRAFAGPVGAEQRA